MATDSPKTIEVDERTGEARFLPPAVREGGPPAQLMTLALEKGAGIDVIERLATLYKDFEDRSAKRAFFEAMAKFQKEVPALPKDSTVDYTSKSGIRTHYRHASLGAIANTIRDALEANGLSYRWETTPHDDGRLTVTCIVTHVQGHSERTSMTAPADDSGSKNPLQAIGSGQTYLRRYTLVPALGLSDTEDTDGRPDRDGAARQEDTGAGGAESRKEEGTRRATSPAPAKADAKVFIGTEAQPLQIDALKKGDKVRGKVTELEETGWWRLEHINAGCALSKPRGSKAMVPAWVHVGIGMEATVAYTGESKTSSKPFMFLADLVQFMDVPEDAFDGKAASAPEKPQDASGEPPKGPGTSAPPARTIVEATRAAWNALRDVEKLAPEAAAQLLKAGGIDARALTVRNPTTLPGVCQDVATWDAFTASAQAWLRDNTPPMTAEDVHKHMDVLEM